MDDKPYILAETDSFAVAFKPSRMHCAPQGQNTDSATLLEWYASAFPPVLALAGRQAGEGGLMHRLDFETQGLVLFAKNQGAQDFFADLQHRGNFAKEYSAVCHAAQSPVPAAGFPPPPPLPQWESPQPFLLPFAIESFFRPFGPGRKAVRPVVQENKHYEIAKDQGRMYKTIVTAFSQTAPDRCAFALRITRGFRHQIRCHLAWAGRPILNDPLYGQQADAAGFLALRAHALIFADPETGQPHEYRIPLLE